ncbi:hypothetical protein J1N35_015533 [Gossypium stocksii]|uniref:Reverse transcriptase domain-containing protein n=1 Tax=Gossypium stocksii TaxID=47602 RepID=A0A9D3VWK3_9ROSI|nr:hypothetical protein J1N35_015533 [Gossypium stocksii]
MAPLKALGSDGFHVLFYQSQWDYVGVSICSWVKEVFEGKSIDPELNNTLIVLIPKTPNPEDFSQFRPISLCSVLYKLVMKIIANHFKVVFPRFLAPEQTGFVARRNITDNIIITQEVIHSMRGKEKKRKWMAIKIDLEKAFDQVRLSRGGPPLSHLFFADDLIIFGHANDNQARVIKTILDEFCDYSSHQINS